MEKKSCKVPETLQELLEVTTKYASPGPRTHKPEENKAEYLLDATIGAYWAQNLLT